MKKILKFKKNIDGQSLVEFALVLPILIILILGMVEFGWILNGQINVTNAAREGARVAAIYKDSTRATNAVVNALSTSKVTLRTPPTSINDLTTSENATVIVYAKITPIVGIFPASLVPNPFPLTATAVMKIEK